MSSAGETATEIISPFLLMVFYCPTVFLSLSLCMLSLNSSHTLIIPNIILYTCQRFPLLQSKLLLFVYHSCSCACFPYLSLIYLTSGYVETLLLDWRAWCCLKPLSSFWWFKPQEPVDGTHTRLVLLYRTLFFKRSALKEAPRQSGFQDQVLDSSA